MHYAGLKTEIAKPEYNGKTAQEIADMLNAEVLIIYSRRVDDRDVIREIIDPNAAQAILEKFDNVAQSNKLVKRAMGWLSPNQGGMDVGDVKVRAMLNTLVGTAGITQGDVDALKALAERTSTVAIEAGICALGETVTAEDVQSVV